jgi:hypothetical protein
LDCAADGGGFPLWRECLDHVIVFNEASRHVKSFLAYHHESRTHFSLAKNTPKPQPVHPPACCEDGCRDQRQQARAKSGQHFYRTVEALDHTGMYSRRGRR